MNRSSFLLAPTPQHGSRLRRSSGASSVWPLEWRGLQAQIRAWKKKLAAVKRQLKVKKESFAAHIHAAVDGLSAEQAADLLLTILHIAAFENWWDKYRVTLVEIEGRRDEAARELRGFLKGLGYVG